MAFVELECGTCGMERSYTIHDIAPCIGCVAFHEHHPFVAGPAIITLTSEERELFIGQGDNSGFKGNDLLYPIYEQLKS